MARRAVCASLVVFGALFAHGSGVTIITHGLNGNVDGWVTGMANQITNYVRFPGPDFTIYEMYFFASNSSYYLTADPGTGRSGASSASGEIIVKLDWRQLADGNSYNTYQVASAVVPALLSTNFFPGLGGHALVEFPLHLAGHSRGGSLACELSRQLGTNGIWVDQVTTLDPHPLNDPAFPFDSLFYSDIDAPANTYDSVLFADNYWQNISSPINGKSVAGAFVRKLTSLDGGYSSAHSDVHLWYHGTIDWRTPASDTEASITSSERQSWWSSYEMSGTNAGFLYSLIGGGDRTATNRPVGLAAIREGYNQRWDLGLGVANNRTALPANNGNWPNLMKFNRTTTNQVSAGQSLPVKFYYQWARPSTSFATVGVYLDDDLNPLTKNQMLLQEFTVAGTGSAAVAMVTTNITISTNAVSGHHAIFAMITAGGRSRYLYAPEFVDIPVSRQPPTLDIARLNASQCRIGINGLIGQTIVLQQSADFTGWSPLVTNTLATNRWVYTNSAASSARFYRGLLPANN